MNLSIVIPALNEAANIDTAIDCAWRAGAAEVIVSDGGSTDATRELASDRNCELVQAPPGRASQQNAGAAVATGDVLLFLHADNRLECDAATQIETALQDENIVSGSFRQRIEADGWLYRLVEKGNAMRAKRGRPYGDQAIFVRREIFQQIQGFPDVPLMEDVMLMKRLRKHGKTVLLPGPLHISARRWKRHGVIRQTLRNWTILTAYRCGVSPDTLAAYYARHDQ